MKPVRKFLDRIEPSFEQGGKLERFYPLYEALDTFLYTPRDVTSGPTHVRDAIDLKRLMSTVVVALLPCILMAMYNTGLQANLALQDLGSEGIEGWRGSIITALGVGYDPGSMLANFVHGALYFIPAYIVTQIAGGTCEVIFATIRRHEVNEGFLVTGVLYPLTLPPAMPLWMVAMGIIFGVVIGKEVFGGTGKNFLNPALTARAFLYFAYPTYISGPLVWVAVDGYTAPTPLGSLANADVQSGMMAITNGLEITWTQAFLGFIPGSMGETSALCCLIGAAIMIATGVASWRIMLAVLIGALGSATLFWMFSGQTDNPMFLMPPHWHLVVGGLAFGLVFMATDPVSASMTQTGKWIFGILIGVMTTLIRVINPGYAEGIMLAILFGNVFAPLIDYVVIQANIRRRLVRTAA